MADSDPAGVGERPSGRFRLLVSPDLWACVLVLATGAVLVFLARGLWFVGDDWDFVLGRHLGTDPARQLLTPHNEHWCTVPILLYRLLFAVFGLRHYLPYGLMPIIAHLAVLGLTYRLLRRSGSGGWVAVLGLSTLALLGAGAENTLWDFQITFVLSALAGLAALRVSLMRERPVLRAAGISACLIVALMSSGMGLVMCAWVATVLLLRYGVRHTASALVVPMLVYGAWYATWGRAASSGDRFPSPPAYLRFVISGLDAVWSRALYVPHAGLFVLTALVAVTVLVRAPTTLRQLATGGLVTLVSELLLIGVGRASMGPEFATAGRYVYFGVLFTLPALAIALGGLGRLRSRVRGVPAVVGVLVSVLLLALGARGSLHFRSLVLDAQGPLRDRVLPALELADSGAPLLSDEIGHGRDIGLTLSALEQSPRDDVPRTRFTARDDLEARAYLQVAVETTSPGLLRGTTSPDSYLGVLRPSGPCLTGVATRPERVVLIPVDQGSQLRIRVASSEVTTVLVRHGRASSRVTWDIEPGKTFYVGTVAADARLRVIVPPGPVEIC